MKLYHGTNGQWVNNILRCGLEPRAGKPARNNWKHVPHQSNAKCVYLTDSYAPYFAFNACRGKNPICAVVEIDTDRLEWRPEWGVDEPLYADEDCLEQVSRGKDDVPGDMSQRTLYYRKKQFDFESVTLTDDTVEVAWRFSLRALGTCSHRGVIAPDAITRIAVWPHKPNYWLRFVFDPQISLINQSICGDRYRALTAKLFGDQYLPFKDIGGWTDMDGNPLPDQRSPDQKVLDSFDPAKIEGLEIIDVRQRHQAEWQKTHGQDQIAAPPT